MTTGSFARELPHRLQLHDIVGRIDLDASVVLGVDPELESLANELL
jgi:hypothetical protein